MVTGEEGLPQGVVGVMWAARTKSGSCERPVPPITAIRTGSDRKESVMSRYDNRHCLLCTKDDEKEGTCQDMS